DVVLVRALSTSGAETVELDEYHSSGLQSSALNAVSIPGSGSNKLTIGSRYEGGLKLSGDGNFLTLAGSNVGNSLIVGRVSVGDGTVDLSTKFPTFGTIFGAVTSNGTDIWIEGSSGVSYTTLGSSITTVISHPYTAGGNVGIFGGQLYSTVENSSPNIVTA